MTWKGKGKKYLGPTAESQAVEKRDPKKEILSVVDWLRKNPGKVLRNVASVGTDYSQYVFMETLLDEDATTWQEMDEDAKHEWIGKARELYVRVQRVGMPLKDFEDLLTQNATLNREYELNC